MNILLRTCRLASEVSIQAIHISLDSSLVHIRYGASCSGLSLYDTRERTEERYSEDVAGHAFGTGECRDYSAVCDRAAPRTQNQTDTRTRETAVPAVPTPQPRKVSPFTFSVSLTFSLLALLSFFPPLLSSFFLHYVFPALLTRVRQVFFCEC